MRPGQLQAQKEAKRTEGLESGKSRIFQWPALLRKGVATEAEKRERHDTRRDTPFKANTEAYSADPGGQDRSDTRRDKAQKGWQHNVCGLWMMIQDTMALLL